MRQVMVCNPRTNTHVNCGCARPLVAVYLRMGPACTLMHAHTVQDLTVQVQAMYPGIQAHTVKAVWAGQYLQGTAPGDAFYRCDLH